MGWFLIVGFLRVLFSNGLVVAMEYQMLSECNAGVKRERKAEASYATQKIKRLPKRRVIFSAVTKENHCIASRSARCGSQQSRQTAPRRWLLVETHSKSHAPPLRSSESLEKRETREQWEKKEALSLSHLPGRRTVC